MPINADLVINLTLNAEAREVTSKDVETMRVVLMRAAEFLANRGFFTEGTDLVVDGWESNVESLLVNEYGEAVWGC